MPSTFFERIPLPSLQTYTSFSILMLSGAFHYATKTTSQPEWKLENFKEENFEAENETDSIERKKLLQIMLANGIISHRLYDIIYFMIQEPLFVWILINMAYCCLFLFGKFIQKIVFGKLRVVERQHLKDKFWNFVFYKFIFIFGVMNVQFMDEVAMWCSWFSVVGFFCLFAQLCKDRFEYLSFSPTTPKWTHIRLFTLILSILVTSISLCIIVGFYAGFNTYCFMIAECASVALKSQYVLIRYILHLWDASHEGTWERRGIYAYYCELIFELLNLSLNFFHHLHMLLWGNIFLSMASLVICMQLRFLLHEIQRKLMRHKNYLKVARHMENNYPLATQEEIESNSDDCAICWDHMESARKLPCGHMFHTSCLRSWLEQVTTCPTCRTTLINKDNNQSQTNEGNRNHTPQEDPIIRQPNQTTNHFFHFDGSRYVSWFPSFSVEVSHTSLLGERQEPIQTSQLDNMAHQVLQMFPHMPFNMILEDLRLTHSVEVTVENILEERLVAPPPPMFPSSTTSPLQAILSSSFNRNIATSSGASTDSPDGSIQQSPAVAPLPSNQKSSDDRIAPSSMRPGGDGCRFSKSSQEREHMLSLRKDDLIKKARNKYISRICLDEFTNSGPSTSKE